MVHSGALLAFLIPGPREVVLVALVALALYGRSGWRVLAHTRYGRLVSPWVSRTQVVRRIRPAPGRSPAPSSLKPAPAHHGRWFWAFALTGAAAVAAWIATRLVILGTPR